MSDYPHSQPLESLQNGNLSRAIEFFSSCPRCFSLGELVEWVDNEIECVDASQILTEDRRFVHLGVYPDGESYFIPETALFRWYAGLTVRLANIPLAKLPKCKLALPTNSLGTEEARKAPPKAAIDFGNKFGFINEAPTLDYFVFPLADVIACLTPRGIRVAASILDSFIDTVTRGSLLKGTLDDMVQCGFDGFRQKSVVVMKCREGLTSEGRMTLEEIGTRIGVTRSRIQQIESSFWNKLYYSQTRGAKSFHSFLVAFLSEIMRKQGSLIVMEDSTEAALMLFCVKCLGIKFVQLDQFGIVIVGYSSKCINTKSLMASKRGVSKEFPEYLDEEFIVKQLASQNEFCLSDNDTSILAKAISAKRMRELDKGQRVHLVLRDIGEPAHFLDVTKNYNSKFSDDVSSPRSIHGILDRGKYGVVWVGTKGVYGLKELGCERPSDTLYNTVAKIVRNRYSETDTPVSEPYILSELEKYRYQVDSTSFLFITHNNPDLRVVLGSAFVPIDLVDLDILELTDSDKDWFYKRIFPVILLTWKAKDNQRDRIPCHIYHLPVSFLCGPEILGQQKTKILSLGKDFIIRDLIILMNRGFGFTKLASVFKTITQLEYADSALNRFSDAVLKWESNERRSSIVSWIVPDALLTDSLALRTDGSDLFWEVLRDSDGDLQETLLADSFVELWLPFLSLELINTIRGFSPADFPILRIMLVKTSRQADRGDIQGPWDPAFPQTLLALCIYSLYQYEPTDRGMRMLIRLREAHCTNIGHLVAFHPKAIMAIKKLDPEVWIKLTVAFRNALK